MGGYDLRSSVKATCRSLAVASASHQYIWVDNSFLCWRGETGHSFNRHRSIADAFYTSGIRKLFSRDDSFVTTTAMVDERRRAINGISGGGSLTSLRNEVYRLFNLLEVRRRIVDAREILGYSDICEKVIGGAINSVLCLSHVDITILCASVARTNSGFCDALLTDDSGIIAGVSYLTSRGFSVPVYSRILPRGKSRLEAIKLSAEEINFFLDKKLARSEKVL
ncbi:hypothetical protein HY483_03650 [Candidatus Woesearchaeota archaeon]|nr:hypothetical protein [Candidatus Woesearchaeota archaeon]